MTQDKKEAREFWIYKGTSNFYDELVLDEGCENFVKNNPEGFYDIVSEKDTIEGAIHVIEYSAYAELLKQNEQLKQKLEVAKRALELIASNVVWVQDHGNSGTLVTYGRSVDQARQALKEIGE